MGFSLSGVYYPEGSVVEIDPDTAAALPEGVAVPEVEAEPPPPPPPPPPPKGSK
jgi:hypothetical protein